MKNDYKVSLYHNVKSPPVAEATLHEIYLDIKNEIYADEIAVLRGYVASGNKVKEDEYKKTLPCFTVSAIFRASRTQAEQYIQHYTGMICMDWDDVPNVEEKIKELADDDYLKLLFLSPSGTGIKGVIQTDNEDWKLHKEVFRQTDEYFFGKYGLRNDESCKDVNRLCFFSSDKNAIWNE